MASFIHRILSKPGFGLVLFLILFLTQYSFAQSGGVGSSYTQYALRTTDSVIVLRTGGGEGFLTGYQTVQFVDGQNNTEYVRIKKRSGDTLFVLMPGRGMEGGIPRIWPPYTIVNAINYRIIAVTYSGVPTTSNTAQKALTLLLATPDTLTSFLAQPSVPYAPALYTNITTIAGIAYFHGRNVRGDVISEFDTIVTSSSEFDCKNAYASLDTVILPIRTHSTGDSVSIGASQWIGVGTSLMPQTTLEGVNATTGTARTGATLVFNPTVISKNLLYIGGDFDGSSTWIYYFIK